MSKKTMQKAKDDKFDEYYTQYETIEKEMIYYIKYFENKIIYCNTDDMNSNFWKYFDDNFEKFKLKKLIATKYNKNGNGEKYELLIENNKKKYYKTKLKEDGDFESNECIEILKESDIIITNPPFSLFRKFIDIIMKYNKNFIVLSNQNAITYKDFYPFIIDKRIWLGVSIHSGEIKFEVPIDFKLNTYRIIKEGNKLFIKITGVRWFTNLSHNIEPPFLSLTKKYNEKDYPKYDNKNAIHIDKTKNIPCDYDGLMGVPITFLDKYNSEQFEIVDFCKGDDNKDLRINGKRPYFRILIRKR